MMLWDTHGDKFDIRAILIKRDEGLIQVPKERKRRDRCRVRIEEAAYSLVIENNGELEDFLKEACQKIKNLLQTF